MKKTTILLALLTISFIGYSQSKNIYVDSLGQVKIDSTTTFTWEKDSDFFEKSVTSYDTVKSEMICTKRNKVVHVNGYVVYKKTVTDFMTINEPILYLDERKKVIGKKITVWITK